MSSGSGLSTKEEEGFLEALIGVITPEEVGKRSVAAINSLPEQELQEWARAERLSGARRRRRADDNRERVIEERGKSLKGPPQAEDAASLRLALQLDREEKNAVRWQRDQQDTRREGGQAGRKGWEHDVIAPGVAPPKVDTLVAGNLNGDFALDDLQRGVVSSGLKHDVHGYGQHFKHQFPQGQMSHQSMPQSLMYHPHQMQGILHSVQQNRYNVHQREGPGGKCRKRTMSSKSCAIIMMQNCLSTIKRINTITNPCHASLTSSMLRGLICKLRTKCTRRINTAIMCLSTHGPGMSMEAEARRRGCSPSDVWTIAE